jgi:hypothetical protein
MYYGHLEYVLRPFGMFLGHLVYFLAIWNEQRPFGIFLGHLVIKWSFGIFSPVFGTIVSRKIWQPWKNCRRAKAIPSNGEVFWNRLTEQKPTTAKVVSNFCSSSCSSSSSEIA